MATPDLVAAPIHLASRLLLVRHAMPWLAPGPPRMLGWTDVPLSEEGEAQARQLAHRLKHAAADALYSSPLTRALDTARVIADACHRQINVDEDLREIHCGTLEGMTTEEAQTRFPELWTRHLAQSEDDFRWPGGESYRQFRERCLGALDRISLAHPRAAVIVVTHAGVISQALGKLTCVPPSRWEPNRPDHASATAVDWHDSQGSLVAFNSREHLLAAERR